MTNEFKKITGVNETHYVLETASGGATSSGSIASAPGGVGKVQKRGNLLAQEEKKEPPKPRNFVAKNAKMGGAGQHKDKKKAEKQGDVKHRKPFSEQGVAESGPFSYGAKLPRKGSVVSNAILKRKEQDKNLENNSPITDFFIDIFKKIAVENKFQINEIFRVI